MSAPAPPPPPPPTQPRPSRRNVNKVTLILVGVMIALILVIAFRAVFGPLIAGVGLVALIVGVVAVKRGSVAWARVPTKQAGWLVVVAGVFALAVGGAITPPDGSTPTSATAKASTASARPLVAAAPTTTTPVPVASVTAAPSPTKTTAKPKPPTPKPSATHSTPTPSPKPKPKPVQKKPAPPAHHACTRTSSGTCIQGGEFCKQALYGTSGWDAAGRRYVCEGDHTHPHWMTP